MLLAKLWRKLPQRTSNWGTPSAAPRTDASGATCWAKRFNELPAWLNDMRLDYNVLSAGC